MGKQGWLINPSGEGYIEKKIHRHGDREGWKPWERLLVKTSRREIEGGAEEDEEKDPDRDREREREMGKFVSDEGAK